MVSQSSSAALQRQMRAARRELNEHADQMVEKARTRFNWRRFVADHPWTSLGSVMVIAYLLVPRRARCRGADAAMIQEAVDRMARAAPPHSGGYGILGGLMTAVAATLMREAAAFASQRAREWFQQNGTGVTASHAENGNGCNTHDPDDSSQDK